MSDYQEELANARNLVGSLDRDARWALLQAVAEPSRFYGDGGTIHDSGTIDVVQNAKGDVVQVWFRCQNLPFRVSRRESPADVINPNIGVSGVFVSE